jgi:hypothetical protein
MDNLPANQQNLINSLEGSQGPAGTAGPSSYPPPPNSSSYPPPPNYSSYPPLPGSSSYPPPLGSSVYHRTSDFYSQNVPAAGMYNNQSHPFPDIHSPSQYQPIVGGVSPHNSPVPPFSPAMSSFSAASLSSARSYRGVADSVPGASLLFALDNSRYTIRTLSHPNAPPTISPGACAALTAQFLVRSMERGSPTDNLGTRGLIEAIQSDYESAAHLDHEADRNLLRETGLDVVGVQRTRNRDINDWTDILRNISSVPGYYYVALENDERDGHIVGFINDGTNIYHINSTEGISNLGASVDMPQRAARYMTEQHDQDSITVYRVRHAPLPDPRRGRPDRTSQRSHGDGTRRRPIPFIEGGWRSVLRRGWNRGDVFEFIDQYGAQVRMQAIANIPPLTATEADFRPYLSGG